MVVGMKLESLMKLKRCLDEGGDGDGHGEGWEFWRWCGWKPKEQETKEGKT